MKFLKQLLFFIFLLTLSNTYAQDSKQATAFGNDWTATDALGRSLPTYREVGPMKVNKYVGVFYFLWHWRVDKIRDVSKILLNNPANPAWQHAKTYYWGEPEAGYYCSDDPWVMRRNIIMLADAGVDFVFLDYTNDYQWAEFDTTLETYCQILEELKSQGIDVPKICFFFKYNPESKVENMYNNFYKLKKYSNLWFYWDGKPLILAPSDTAQPMEIRNFFTWREMWDFSGTQNQWWKYTDYYPQMPFYQGGKLEEICVCKAIGAPVQTIEEVTNRGASFHNGKPPYYNQYWVSSETSHGLYFEDQWTNALKVNPPIITVTGWNEWIAGAWDANFRDPKEMLGKFTFMGKLLTKECPFYFVDEFNMEFNRDIEPMKDGYTDDYYYQLVSNIRKYKGLNLPERATPPKTITMDGNFTEWLSVKPVFRDAAGDVAHRNFRNIDSRCIYTNITGRNDIVESRATYDSNNVYFYVRTKSSLTPYTDKNWMLLFIDADTNHATGWEGYDYVVNLKVKSDSITTLAAWNSRNSSWIVVTDLKYRFTGNQMEIRVPRSLINQTGKDISFNFHWADNIQKLNDITDFFIDGDSAPDRRFNYYFTTKEW